MNSLPKKVCSKCKVAQDLSAFYKATKEKDGLAYSCKACAIAYSKVPNEHRKEYLSAYREANREKMAEYSRQYERTHKVERAEYLEKNRESRAANNKVWREANREYVDSANKAWREANPERAAENNKAWREANSERAAETGRAWRKANPEKVSKNNRDWYKANTEKASEYSRAWNLENPEKHAMYSATRKALKLKNGTFYIRPKFMRRLYSSPCIVCSSRENICADHTLALARGGVHGESNLQPMCIPCNSSKNSKLMIHFKIARPDLFLKS